jgi:DNA-directed RNA polymerase specialized sigma24 family protein
MPEALPDGPFEALLVRLGPDRESAGQRYEQLRRRLVSIFEYRRCPHPEELADETLDRAARRLLEIGSEFAGSDPARYVFGVAWNVARESFRRPATVPLPEGWERRTRASDAAVDEHDELGAGCLEDCLQRLPAPERNLILSYHQDERSARIRRRSDIARDLSVSPNALRLKIHRLTARLRECVIDCMGQGGWEPRSA